jgi:hypothetical protein
MFAKVRTATPKCSSETKHLGRGRAFAIRVDVTSLPSTVFTQSLALIRLSLSPSRFPPFSTGRLLYFFILFTPPWFQLTHHINLPAAYSPDISALTFSLLTLLARVPHDLFAFLFELLPTGLVNL